MPKLKGIADLTITDIPYGGVNHSSSGLRNLDKGKADRVTFNLSTFLPLIYKATTGTIIIFCGQQQLSEIYDFFLEHQRKRHGTVRQLIYEKRNPSVLNAQYGYMSGIENAIWFRKHGATFNAKFKNTVFRYSAGKSNNHPTEKNHELIRELIQDNSNVGDIVLDCCCGSGSILQVAKEENRHYIGIEIDKSYYQLAIERLKNV